TEVTEDGGSRVLRRAQTLADGHPRKIVAAHEQAWHSIDRFARSRNPLGMADAVLRQCLAVAVDRQYARRPRDAKHRRQIVAHQFPQRFVAERGGLRIERAADECGEAYRT